MLLLRAGGWARDGAAGSPYKSLCLYYTMSCLLMHDETEATDKISIDDLFQRKHAQDLKQLSTFHKILNRVHRRIQITSRHKRDKYIWFVVPEYIIGESVFNNTDCIAFIVAKLSKNGFFVRYFHPNTIFVSWDSYVPSYVRTEFKKRSGIAIDENGRVVETADEYTDMRAGGEVSKQGGGGGGGEQNPYASIKQYRPSGKLIYNQDIFEKMEKTFQLNT